MVFSIAGHKNERSGSQTRLAPQGPVALSLPVESPTDNWNSLKLTYKRPWKCGRIPNGKFILIHTLVIFRGPFLLVYREESCDTQSTRSTKIFPSAICFYLLRCHAFRSKHVFCLGSVSSGHHGPSGLSVHLFLPLKPWWEASKQGKQQTATRSSPMGVYFYAFWGYFDTMMRKYLIERIHGIFETT